MLWTVPYYIPNSCDPWGANGQPGSAFGTNLDVVAPGTNIFTTGILGATGYGAVINNGVNGVYFSGFSGTSAAAPHVAGIAALILSVRPDLTQAQVRHAIVSTARNLPAHPPTQHNGQWNQHVGFGLVDAERAVISALRTSVSISAPTVICVNSSATISANNWPSGFRWEVSHNLRINGVNTNRSVSVTATANGQGWVRIMHGTTEVARREIWVGVPDVNLNSNRVDGPINLVVGQVGAYSVSHSPLVLPPHATIRWTATGQSASISSIGRFANISFWQAGSYQISAAISNECGSTFAAFIDVNVSRGGGGFDPPACNCNPSWGCSCLFFGPMVFPNPASDILNIEIGTAPASIPFRTDIARSDNLYEIRLYNDRGSLVRQLKARSGATQLNVSNLPTGVYSLHIHDGVSCSPDVRQIIIRR